MIAGKNGRGPARPVAHGSPVPEDVLASAQETGEAYIAHLERTGLAPSSIRLYAQRVRAFAEWLDSDARHDPLRTFTDQHDRDFATRDYRTFMVHDRELAPATTDGALGAIDGLFAWVGLGPSTTGRVSTGKGAPGDGEYLTPAQSTAVLRAAERRGARDLAIVAVLRFAGLRVEELTNLNVDDVRMSERQGELSVRGKGYKHRKVPLNSKVRPLLQRWELERRSVAGSRENQALFLSNRGQRIAVRTVHHLVVTTGREAGVEGLHPHLFRHTFARRLLDEGVPVTDVQDYLGHKDLNTTMRYTRPTAEQRAAGIERGVEDW